MAPSSEAADTSNSGPSRVLVDAAFEKANLTGAALATRPASAIASYCRGYIGTDANFFLRVEREATLSIFARPSDDPELDLVMVVVSPDGKALCVDDADGIHPRLEGTFLPGEYRVLVGAYEEGKSGAVHIEVSDALKVLPSGPAPTPLSEGTYGGLSLPAAVGPGHLRGRAGGVREASTVGPGCVGFIASKPDHVLFVEEPMRLQISARGNDTDLALVLQSADGRVICNDDADGLNPQLEDEFQSGVWNVYVGTWRPAQYPDYVLRVSR